MIVQVLPAGIPPPQVSVSTNWELLEVIVTVCVMVLSLVTVNVFAALVCPIATEPKAREAGVTVMGSIPVPCSATEVVPRL